MAKNALILSPFFFGLIFLVWIAFISEKGGGVRGQIFSSCSPGNPFGYRVQQDTCLGCNSYCDSLDLHGKDGAMYICVKWGTCFQVAALKPVSDYFCVCCIV
ncbi:hypothetical protein MKW98_003961 [Papaver atlanticum]|uniref:Uncharacterized protein n=1 Tax=Papaver atlanticum TaxID=357466 RepID=A0AAD4SNL5_9MAGN|nr:hypothetical protein MKW98_003961 [Papaver atlanticum]